MIALAITPAGNPLAIILEEPVGLSPANAAAIRNRKRAYMQFIIATLDEIAGQGGLTQRDTRVAAFAMIGIVLWFARWYRPHTRKALEAIIEQLTDMAVRSAVREAFLPRTRLDPGTVARRPEPNGQGLYAFI